MKLHYNFSLVYRWIMVVLVVIGIGLLGVLGIRYGVKKPLSHYADLVYQKCKDIPYAPSCYDREIPKLMDKLSMEEAFEVTKLIQNKDQRYLYCHVLAHNLSFRETEKDLSKWKDVVTRCPTTLCNNGCQHGALMRRFNAESLTDAQIEEVKPDLMDVCEPRGHWNPKEIERSMCYHALGHLNMFITQAHIPKSVGLCEAVGSKSDGRSYTQTCTQGVLMSVYQPLEPEDIALVKDIAPTKETVGVFCDQFSGEAWFACHSESWPLFLDELYTPQGLMNFCSYTEDPSKKQNCISTVMGILTVSLVINRENKLDELASYCDALPSTQKAECYASSAFRLIQIDPRYTPLAVSTCGVADRAGVGKECFSYIIPHVRESFGSGSAEGKVFCDEFGEPWKSECLTQWEAD
jgi:hypothetical protein